MLKQQDVLKVNMLHQIVMKNSKILNYNNKQNAFNYLAFSSFPIRF